MPDVTDHGVGHSPNAVTLATVSLHRVLQMRGGGHADVLPVLQVPANKADAVPCEGLLPDNRVNAMLHEGKER
jgi:hypothetical protein